jgi:hypothetical protein
VVAVVVAQVTASTVHLKAEVRRLEELLKHELAQRKETMLRQAAQSEAANQKSEADMFRVLAGAEHQDAVEMTKKKNKRSAMLRQAAQSEAANQKSDSTTP